MLRSVLLLAVAGCGRIGFGASELVTGDAATDGPRDVSASHDEDGDGVVDGDDTCPHLDGPQTDGDGDGVGDLCDPNPTTPGDILALFATLGPGDQPFTPGGGDLSAVFTQLPDALRFDGELGADGNLYGNLVMPMPLGNARVALGIDVLEVLPGSASNQNQIALAVWDQPPNYFVELNQIPGLFDQAAITLFDGSTYTTAETRDLATGLHDGPVFLQTTQRVGEAVKLNVAWPGEPYEAAVLDNLYQGGARIEMSFNNVHLELRYLIVITSP